jgi:hypothetical protein
MSSVVISGDTSGAITLSAPAVSGTNTATLPAATGTVMVSGNMPAFSAYASTPQTFTSGTLTKITFGTEEFDTNNNFASSRLTPTVAGYYQLNFMLNAIDTSTGVVTVFAGYFYKNGARYQDGFYTSSTGKSNSSSLIYFNGSTDYVEVYCVVITTSTAGVYGGAIGTGQSWFTGSLVRAA